MTGLATAFGYPYNAQYLLNGHSCCENTSSQLTTANSPHVCSCHVEQALQRKMQTTIPIGLLPSPGYSTQPSVMFTDPTIYPSLRRQYDLKDMSPNTAALNPAWFGLNARFDAHNFERNAYLAFNRFGERFSPIDLNSGARRKNATKETTSTLKAWLYEHRKNPYPTKGEKIMLAILTKMTLTQVSTWFANARRRLKKENKMTWSPRNRCGEKKEHGDYSDDEDDPDELDGDDNHEDENNEETKQNDQKNISKQVDQTVTRTTTVIKSVEGVRNEKINAIPAQLERSLVWQRSAVEETQHKNDKCNLEDSPVKSLRRWVDGCFDRDGATSPSPHTPPPPRTPANDVTERLNEHDGVQYSPCQSPTQYQSLHRNARSITREHQDNEKTSEKCLQKEKTKEDGTSNREIDAALVLTTLFTRS